MDDDMEFEMQNLSGDLKNKVVSLDLGELQRLKLDEKLQKSLRKCEQLEETVTRLLEENKMSGDREKRAVKRCKNISAENLRMSSEFHYSISELNKQLKNKNVENERLAEVFQEKYDAMVMKMGKEIEDLRHEKFEAIKKIEELGRQNVEKLDTNSKDSKGKDDDDTSGNAAAKIGVIMSFPKSKKGDRNSWAQGEDDDSHNTVNKISHGSQAESNPPGSVYNRRRPTTSERRNRRAQSQTEDVLVLPVPQLESQFEPHVDATGPSMTTTEEGETYPFPGGPEDDSLLYAYKTHVARCLWKGEERQILKTLSHTSKLHEWKIAREDSSKEWKRLFFRTGLSAIPSLSYAGCNKNLVAAFVERWHPETNTFHLPFGEMTITLDDVLCLTGLSIDGRSVRAGMRERTRVEIHEQLRHCFGVSDVQIADARGSARGSSVRLEWLHSTFGMTIQSAASEDVAIGCRAYLLYLFGCTLFADKSGNRVPTHWIDYLGDVELVGQYAWGAAVLAYLYRQLGAASRAGVKQMGGYFTLLEAWIYERFPSVRCGFNVDYVEGKPLAFRWLPQGNAGPSFPRLQSYRETLDLLTAEEVIWCPYDDYVRAHFPLSQVVFYRGCLSAHDVVEPYHPDRVLRQFGYIQAIPGAPIHAGDIPRGDSYSKILLKTIAPFFDMWRDHVMGDDHFIRRVTRPSECTSAYMTWYTRSSHPCCQNPKKRSSSTWRPPSKTTRDPWQMITRARDLIGADAELWRAGERALDWPLVMGHMLDAYDALDLSAPADEGPSRHRRRQG